MPSASFGQRDLLVGGIWLAVGLVITVGTYEMVRGEGGGKYILAYGAMFWGLVRIIRGMDRTSSGIDRPFWGGRRR